MRNSVLSNAAQKILDTKTPAQFTITAKFFSADSGSTFAFYPLWIEMLILNRNYADKYSDEFDLFTTISPKDYALMQDQGENLRCTLTFTYTDQFGKEIFEPAPIQRQYSVFINDPKDIRKLVPDVHLYTEPNTQISVRLIETNLYNQRHTKLNVIYQKVTVGQVIQAITQHFEISRLHMVPPENTHVYDHITIGSMQGISSVYGYLQSVCGVYSKGINSYITNDTLFVYPAFDTDPTYDKTLNFYQAETGQYAGFAAYHRTEGNDVSVVVNSQSESFDLTLAGSENVGTGFIFNRASTLTDGFTQIDPSSGAKFSDQVGLSISLNDARSTNKKSNNVFRLHATDNPYIAMSEIMAHQASLMKLKWQNADPFLVDPCVKVAYYYDDNEAMVKKTGMVESARYVFSNIRQVGSRDLYGCVGDMVLRLSPNVSKTI